MFDIYLMLCIVSDGRERGGVCMCERSGCPNALADGDGAAAGFPRYTKLHRGQTRHGRRK